MENKYIKKELVLDIVTLFFGFNIGSTIGVNLEENQSVHCFFGGNIE